MECMLYWWGKEQVLYGGTKKGEGEDMKER